MLELAASGAYSGGYELTDETAATILCVAVWLSNINNWDGAGYDLTLDEIDQIRALVAQLENDITQEAEGVGDYKLLDQVSANADVSDLTLDDWDADGYQFYRLIVSGLKTNDASTADSAVLQLNGNTTVTDYNQQVVFSYNATQAIISSVGTHAGFVIYYCATAATAPSGTFGGFTADFFNPDSHHDKKLLQWDAAKGSEVANTVGREVGTGWFEDRDPIDEIKLLPYTGTEFLVDLLDDDDPSFLVMSLYGLAEFK